MTGGCLIYCRRAAAVVGVAHCTCVPRSEIERNKKHKDDITNVGKMFIIAHAKMRNHIVIDMLQLYELHGLYYYCKTILFCFQFYLVTTIGLKKYYRRCSTCIYCYWCITFVYSVVCQFLAYDYLQPSDYFNYFQFITFFCW